MGQGKKNVNKKMMTSWTLYVKRSKVKTKIKSFRLFNNYN